MSHVACQVSHVTCHMLRVRCHIFPLTLVLYKEVELVVGQINRAYPVYFFNADMIGTYVFDTEKC